MVRQAVCSRISFVFFGGKGVGSGVFAHYLLLKGTHLLKKEENADIEYPASDLSSNTGSSLLTSSEDNTADNMIGLQ